MASGILGTIIAGYGVIKEGKIICENCEEDDWKKQIQTQHAAIIKKKQQSGFSITLKEESAKLYLSFVNVTAANTAKKNTNKLPSSFQLLLEANYTGLKSLCNEYIRKYHTKDPKLFRMRSQSHYFLGKFQDAKEDIDFFLLNDPENVAGLSLRGNILRDIADYYCTGIPLKIGYCYLAKKDFELILEIEKSKIEPSLWFISIAKKDLARVLISLGDCSENPSMRKACYENAKKYLIRSNNELWSLLYKNTVVHFNEFRKKYGFKEDISALRVFAWIE